MSDNTDVTALEQMVIDGLMEASGTGDDRRYRLTPRGVAFAERAMATNPEAADLYARMCANSTGATLASEPKRRQ